MKIAIPTDGNELEDLVASHFGRAKNFLIYDTDNNKTNIIPNTSQHMGGQGVPPELLIQNNVNIVVCNSLGPKAVTNLKAAGIEIYCGATNSIKQAIKDFSNNKLTQASKTNICYH